MCIQRAKGLFNTKRGSRLPVGVDTTRSFLSVLIQMTWWWARIIFTTLFLFIFFFPSLCICSFFFFFSSSSSSSFVLETICFGDSVPTVYFYSADSCWPKNLFWKPKPKMWVEKPVDQLFQGSMLVVFELESRQGYKNPNQGELPVTSLVTRSKQSQRLQLYVHVCIFSLKARPCANTAHLSSKCNVCKTCWEQQQQNL